MYSLNMLDHISMQREADMARFALVLPLPIMALHMAVQVGRASKASTTRLALERFLPVMRRADVLNQQVFVAITGDTAFAFKRATVFVDCAHVFLHVGVSLEL